ncbi:MAG: hypothetical protein AAB851_04090 [Patescibacteria group bacterium]
MEKEREQLQEAIKNMKKSLLQNYGPQWLCSEYDKHCSSCNAWRKFEAVEVAAEKFIKTLD